MHASLASIGRACTVEDEEPPETPQHSSIDSQTDYFEQCLRPPGWTAPELVEKTSGLLFPSSPSSLSNAIQLWPYSDQTTRARSTTTTSTEIETDVKATDDRVGDADATTTGTVHSFFPPAAEIHLNRLSRLHRLCELARRTFQLDAFTSAYTELSSGLANLYTHTDNITLKEYELLEATLSEVSRAYCSPVLAQSNQSLENGHSVRSEYAASNIGTSPPSSTLQASIYPHNHFRTHMNTTSGTLSSSQLGELRVICESLRQCLTQIKRFFHEQQATNQLVRQFSIWDSKSRVDLFNPPTLTLIVNTDKLTSATIMSSHHLVYSGLSLLAHTDITRHTHGDLWEMTRGIEELDILNRNLQVTRITAHSDSMCKMIMEKCVGHHSDRTTPLLLQELKTRELLYDPVITACPISVGYLFALIAYQRSIRLSHAIYQQLSAVGTLDSQASVDTVEAITAQKGRLTLVEAFRVYLNQNYDRTASEYLRNEYEFIAGFLDVLSQSTNLLYQVQKLKLLCSAAAAAQAKKTELDRQLHRPRFSKPTTNNEYSNAVSVEGVHGILVKRLSFEQEANATVAKSAKVVKIASKSARCLRKGSATKSAVSQYQETLHRAGTLDRYVATGSVNCPLSSTDSSAHEGNKAITEGEADDPSSRCTETKTSKTVSSKKVVQWSDHREISTRHQVIGRFLEMTWRYTETQFNNLFLCPPTTVIAREQSSSMRNEKFENQCSSGTTHPSIGGQCTTTSCLLMKPEHIRVLASHIRELAKPDIFPAGLIPVLKRQALRLLELAHRRCWFTDIRSRKSSYELDSSFTEPPSQRIGATSIHAIQSNVASIKQSSPDVCFSSRLISANCQPMNTESNETSINLPSFQQRIHENCAISYIRRMTEAMKARSSVSCCRCVSTQFSLLTISSELTTVLRLSVEIMSHFTKDRSKVEFLINTINTKLREIDILVDCKRTAPLSAELTNQPDTMIQSAYDISRRLSISAHRLNLHVQTTVQQLKQRTVQALNCTCLLELKDETCDLLVGVPQIGLAVAQLTQILILINVICSALEVIVNEIGFSYRHMHQDFVSQWDSLSTVPRSSEIETKSTELIHNCGLPAELRIRLPNGIRLGRTFASFKRAYVSLSETNSLIVETVASCTASFSTRFMSRVHIVWSRATDPPTRQIIMEKFIRGIFTSVLPCEIECHSQNMNSPDSEMNELSRRVSSCPFHQVMYSQVLGRMFGHFCSEWLTSTSVCTVVDISTKTKIIENHAQAVENLRFLMMRNHQSASKDLLATLCDSVEFQRLLASVSKSSKLDQDTFLEINPATRVDSSIQPPENKASEDPMKTASHSKISRHLSTVMTNTPRVMKDKFTSKLNSPGETLAAFAAGVKNSIFIPFKHLTTPDTLLCNPTSSVMQPESPSETVFPICDDPVIKP